MEPTIGAVMLPKRTCDVRGIEVCKMLRLTTNTVEPVSATLPRAPKLAACFQDDVYPPAPTGQPSQDAASWLGGSNTPPARASLQPAGMMVLSERPVTPPPQTTRGEIVKNRMDEKKQEEAVKDAEFARLQQLAIAREKFNPNLSMGHKGRPPLGAAGVDAAPVFGEEEDVGDDEWDD